MGRKALRTRVVRYERVWFGTFLQNWCIKGSLQRRDLRAVVLKMFSGDVVMLDILLGQFGAAGRG